ncbi:FkbM family methyltransferase [Wenxinia saemankumensis]|uniref:Methyltransferase, FkbM family n=1 Tax=Wenxinia saemankumensis TaxID=1447782 RepID=A0A1M6HZ56_9RHOB|nr:FkbM family methyltransferase [Wenxinia saemankumensis]SHJ27374.1 methyltransferase, FkbM family [Wenxinia saemankumensis]
MPAPIRVAHRARRAWRTGEPELRLVPKLCSPDLWSVDIGANTGVYTWHMARWSAGVAAFEPQPAHAAVLRRAFGRRVRVEEVALSDRPGTALLRVPVARHEDGRATIEAGNTLAGAAATDHVVPCRCLDSYDLPPTGLVKIDVEGHELAVLRGARALLERDRPHLIVEAEERHRPEALASLCDLLRPIGYRPHTCRDGDLVPLEADPRSGAAGNNFVFLAGASPA